MGVTVGAKETLFRLHDHIHVLADPLAKIHRISPALQLVHLVSLYRGPRGVSLSDLVRFCGAKGFSEEQTLRAARELRDPGLARFTLTGERQECVKLGSGRARPRIVRSSLTRLGSSVGSRNAA